MQRLKQRPFRKREGTRASLFAELDQPALKALPVERYTAAEWKTCRANIDYHIEVDRHSCSVPYHLVGQALEARLTHATVEIFHHGVRIASHVRSHSRTAIPHNPIIGPRATRPTSSGLLRGLYPFGGNGRLRDSTVGAYHLGVQAATGDGILILLGIMRLLKAYSKERLEAASRRAVDLRACSYQSLQSIFRHSLDQQVVLAAEPKKRGPHHGNVRGPGYTTLPTISAVVNLNRERN